LAIKHFTYSWHDLCSLENHHTFYRKEIQSMKKVLSSIVAALVAVAFAGVVFAAEPAKEAAPAAPAAGEMKKEEKAPAKKTKKAKKAKKEMQKMKKEEAPAAPAAK
jgi:hypothetical protein